MNIVTRLASLGTVTALLFACAGNVSLGGNSSAVSKKPCSQAAGCTGAAPAGPNYLCADKVTTAGPACLEENGVCAWSVVQCPAADGGAAPVDAAVDAGSPDTACTLPAGCTDPMPNMPNALCPDGVNSSGPACRQENGACSWKILQCPATNACDKYNLPKCDTCDLLPTQSCSVGSKCILENSYLTCPSGTWQPTPVDYMHEDCHRLCKK